MPHVRLKRSWPGPFRRTLLDAKGKPVLHPETDLPIVATFSPGELVHVDEELMPSLANDIGKALELVDEKTATKELTLRGPAADVTEPPAGDDDQAGDDEEDVEPIADPSEDQDDADQDSKPRRSGRRR